MLRKTPSSSIAVALAVLAICIATLRPSGTVMPSGWSFDIASGEAALAEAIQNLLLFIPLGMALAWKGFRPLRAIAIGAGLSFTVEFIQQWLPGRDPSTGDILCNTISTAIGGGLVWNARRWLFVQPRRAAWQALATALAAAAVWLGSGALLRPIFPPPPYHDVWTPDFNYWGQYRGKVLSASLGSVPLSQGMIPETAFGNAPLRITAIAPPRPPGRTSPLVAILDRGDTKVLLVAVDRTDLVMLYHMRAVDLTFEHPDLRWRHALTRIAPGDTFTVQAWRGERGACLNLNSARRCGLGYTIGDGWKLIFFPEEFSAWALALVNALWLGGWLLGVGYWGGRAGRNPLIYASLGVAIVGLLLVPSIAGLKATPVIEWIGAIGGMTVGYWAAVRRSHAKAWAR
ncbi:MAG TPA: VanZ family protein [Gemmatimonadales bacterium]|nr:VanZ family protein [Gemmatimonadales bacterium]